MSDRGRQQMTRWKQLICKLRGHLWIHRIYSNGPTNGSKPPLSNVRLSCTRCGKETNL